MKALKWLDKHLEEALLVTFICAIVLVMLYQIIRRYIFNASLTWSEEFCRYVFTWFIFIALPYSIKLGSELRMDAIIIMFSPEVLKKTKLVLNIISLAFCLFLFVQSFTTVSDAIMAGEVSSGLHLPKQYVNMSTVAGFGLASFRYMQVLYRSIKGKDDEEVKA